MIWPSRRAIWEGRIDKVDEAIKSLKNEQELCPGLLLTEEDLRLHLCLRLMKIFNRKSQTGDGFAATQVHAEVTWYDEQEDLRLRPDITVLEPKALRLLNEIENDGITLQKLPSKQFVYGGNGTALIFELKFLRNPKNPDVQQIKAIKEDAQKMERLLSMWNNTTKQTVFAYLIVFSKTQYRCESVEQIVNQFNQGGSHRKAFYFSGSIAPELIGRGL